MFRTLGVLLAMAWGVFPSFAGAQQTPAFSHRLWSRAHAFPEGTTSEQSGYFSIVQGHDGRIYVGTAKYGENAFLVAFDPESRAMEIVVDAQREIGTDATGFAAQAKIHTRNNVGTSGRIYFGTKQGYPREGESREDYRGGYPMVYDPADGTTRVYDIPVAGQGIISVTPDESRGLAYISTCSDERPIESTHFMVLDLKSGRYRDLMDCRHMYAFIVVDHRGRAYHPILGGDIARYDPDADRLDRLSQSIDGRTPDAEHLLAHPESHPVNWEVSPDRRTLYSVAMSGNQLYAYDLDGDGPVLQGRSLGPLVAGATATDCRAMCVGPDGTVWAGVAATLPERGQWLHLVRFRPGDPAPVDLGPIAIGNPDYTHFTDDAGEPLPWHHGVVELPDGTTAPRYVVMGICAGSDSTVYLTTLYPLTLHEIRMPRVAGIATVFHHNSHADVILGRLLQTSTLDDRGDRASVELASLYLDQIPDDDIGRDLAARRGVPVVESVEQALLDEEGRLDVDGVLLVAEHGRYDESDTGQIRYPKRRLFEQVVSAFERSGQVVPVFCDKHLADRWDDAKWIYDTAQTMGIPMMAGSSLPGLWRFPPVDVPRNARLDQIVAVSYHRLDAYGFHALEMVQCLAERRAGGETGVARVRHLRGDAVWAAAEEGIYDRTLLNQALARLERPLPEDRPLEQACPEPELFVIDYRDGLRACVFTLNPVVAEWAVAWRDADGHVESTRFWTQEARPFHHFDHLLQGIEKMVHTGQPTWPVERTLLTSGMLDALLTSRRDGGVTIETPWLDVRYRSEWDWRQPPEPPPGRPIAGP